MKTFPSILVAVLLATIFGCGPSTIEEQVSNVNLPAGFPSDIPTPPKTLEVVAAEELPEWFEVVYQCEEKPDKMFRLIPEAFTAEGWKETLSVSMGVTKESLQNFEKPDGRRAACQISLSGESHSKVTLTVLKNKG